MKTGIELIAEERQEQIEKHGRTIASDVENNPKCELARVAGTLAWPEIEDIHGVEESCPENWIGPLWDKMIEKPYKARLIIAGALIAAEIDRLQATE